MKRVTFLEAAASALRKHRNMAEKLEERINSYAADPVSLADSVTELRGSNLRRLRVGGFRALFEESENEIVVTGIGPRGSIYD